MDKRLQRGHDQRGRKRSNRERRGPRVGDDPRGEEVKDTDPLLKLNHVTLEDIP